VALPSRAAAEVSTTSDTAACWRARVSGVRPKMFSSTSFITSARRDSRHCFASTTLRPALSTNGSGSVYGGTFASSSMVAGIVAARKSKGSSMIGVTDIRNQGVGFRKTELIP